MLRPRVRVLFFLFFFLPLGLLAQGQNARESSEQKRPTNQYIEMMRSMGISEKDFREIREKSGGDMEKMMELMRQKVNQRGGVAGFKGQGQGQRDIGLKELMDGNAEELVSKALTPFSRMSEERLVKMFQGQGPLSHQRGRKPPVGNLDLLRENPKLAHFVVRLLRDPKALPKLASILDQRTKLWIFLGINIALFLVSFLIRRRHRIKNPAGGIISSFVHSVYRFVFMIGLRVGVFLLFFKTEFMPFWSIAKKTFL